MKLYLSSKLRTEILSQQLRPQSEDTFIVLPQCTMSCYVSSEEEWQLLFGESGTLSRKIRKVLSDLGVRRQNIYFHNYMINESVSLSDYSYVILPGGDAELGIARLVNSDLICQLKAFSGDIIAYSAGALLLLRKFFLSPNYYYKFFSCHDGLGIVPFNFLLEVHYDESELMNDYIGQGMNELKQDVYAIGNDGALTVDISTGTIETFGSVVLFSWRK